MEQFNALLQYAFQVTSYDLFQTGWKQDEIMDMGGITGVATYPEYTGRGLIHSLMSHVLEHMHKQDMTISFLYPYSIPFYRKMGWEIVSDKLTFTIKDTQLPKPHPVEGMVERVSLDSEDYQCGEVPAGISLSDPAGGF